MCPSALGTYFGFFYMFLAINYRLLNILETVSSNGILFLVTKTSKNWSTKRTDALSVGFFSVYVLVLRFVLLSCTHSVQQTHRQNNNKTFLEHMLTTLMQKVEAKLWPLISSRVVDIWKDVWSANSFTKIISSCHTRNRLSSWLPSWHEKNQHIVHWSEYVDDPSNRITSPKGDL